MARNAILFGCLWYFLIVSMFNKGNIHYLLNALCITALCNVVFVGFQSKGIDPYGIFTFGIMKGGIESNLYAGLMANPNSLSTLLALSFPAFFRKWWCIGIPIVITGMVLTKCSGGVAAVTGGLIFWFIVKYGKVRLKHIFGWSWPFSFWRDASHILKWLTERPVLIFGGLNGNIASIITGNIGKLGMGSDIGKRSFLTNSLSLKRKVFLLRLIMTYCKRFLKWGPFFLLS